MTQLESVVTRFATLLGATAKKEKKSGSKSKNKNKASSNHRRQQGNSVSSRMFSSSSDDKDDSQRELLSLLSDSVGTCDVVCTVPSLDMNKLDEESDAEDGDNPLPKMGEHFLQPRRPRQPMEASVLNNAAEASVKAARVEQKASSSLGAVTSWTRSSLVYAASAIAENAAGSFSSLVDSRVRAWTLLLLRHSLTTGEKTSRSRLLAMLASSIKIESSEIDFRAQPLPASFVPPPRHPDDPDAVLPLLFEIKLKISIQSKACSVKLRAPGTISAEFDRTRSGEMGTGLRSVDVRLDTGVLLESMVKEARMVVFNAVAKATAAGNNNSISSNGNNSPTMSGSSGPANNNNGGDTFVDARRRIKVNSPSQLSGFSSALSLTSKERRTLAAATAKASSIPRGGGDNNRRSSMPTDREIASSRARALKAKSSSLRLSSVLSSAPGQQNRQRQNLKKSGSSVQFIGIDLNKYRPPSASSSTSSLSSSTTADISIVAPPPPKRQKIGEGDPNAARSRLTSFKSFGRPHAGDFGSGSEPKNATFGTFGRSQHFWGRDGKLAARPRPMMPAETAQLLTSQTRRTANATFDIDRSFSSNSSNFGNGSSSNNNNNSFVKPNIHMSHHRLLSQQQSGGAGARSNNVGHGHNGSAKKMMMSKNSSLALLRLNSIGISKSIPRTATALEGWLMERTSRTAGGY